MSDSSEASSPGIVHEFRRDRIEQHVNGNQHTAVPQYVPPAYYPGGKRALSGISLRAFALGIALGVSTLLTLELAYCGHGLWRAPCFVMALSLFHYLEFAMTARYNTADASISSFLLSSNGVAYLAAHSAAMAEVLLRFWLYSDYAPAWLNMPFKVPRLIPPIPATLSITLGFALMSVGQVIRSAAMRQAGANFNHIVQWNKKADHILVTEGVYAFSRHPSYFGFFWWGLGTQVMLGNRICFFVYAAVLWKFFSHRITHEERHLVSFFGQDYVSYRGRVPVRIPFIR